jgi:hypothetical protein
MKISSLLTLAALVLALVSVGCSASGRINVQNDPAAKLPGNAQLAYVTKPVAAPR